MNVHRGRGLHEFLSHPARSAGFLDRYSQRDRGSVDEENAPVHPGVEILPFHQTRNEVQGDADKRRGAETDLAAEEDPH